MENNEKINNETFVLKENKDNKITIGKIIISFILSIITIIGIFLASCGGFAIIGSLSLRTQYIKLILYGTFFLLGGIFGIKNLNKKKSILPILIFLAIISFILYDFFNIIPNQK